VRRYAGVTATDLLDAEGCVPAHVDRIASDRGVSETNARREFETAA